MPEQYFVGFGQGSKVWDCIAQNLSIPFQVTGVSKSADGVTTRTLSESLSTAIAIHWLVHQCRTHQPFLNPKNNKKIYESILLQWWQPHASSQYQCCMVDKFLPGKSETFSPQCVKLVSLQDSELIPTRKCNGHIGTWMCKLSNW